MSETATMTMMQAAAPTATAQATTQATMQGGAVTQTVSSVLKNMVAESGKKSGAASLLSASSAMVLPPSASMQTNDNNQAKVDNNQAKENVKDADGDGERKMMYGVDVNLLFTEQRRAFGKTVVQFERDGGSPRSRKYIRAGGCVVCHWVQVGNEGRFVRHGMQQWRDAQGRVLRQRTYQYGALNGTECMWLTVALPHARRIADGAPVSQAEQVCMQWLVESKQWQCGKQCGTARTFEVHPLDLKNLSVWRLGSVMSTQEWCDGLRNGAELRTRMRDGRVLMSRVWRNDALNGVVQTFFKNGAVQRTCLYVNGKRCGEESVFAADGFILRSTMWHAGVRQGAQVVYTRTVLKFHNGQCEQKKMTARSSSSSKKNALRKAAKSGSSGALPVVGKN